MPQENDLQAAGHLLRVALAHPECIGGEVLDAQSVRLDINVEMPLDMKADGKSPSGVRTTETAIFTLPARYPWKSPSISLRDDFPRNFPHLHPSAADRPPRPCLVDGSQDEFFLQYGLVEYGIFHLIDQLAAWLRKAALNDLIDTKQGWEPMLRLDFDDFVSLDADAARGLVKKAGGFSVWRASFVRKGNLEARPGHGASTLIDSKAEPIPLTGKPGNDAFSATPIEGGFSIGDTIAGLVWPDKHPNGSPHISDRYWPEDISTLRDLRKRAADLGCARPLDLLISNLERAFGGLTLHSPIPVAILLCVRRPTHLIGSSSSIELLPYVIEIRPVGRRTSLFAAGDDEPVAPAAHYQSLTPELLQRLSAVPVRPPMAAIGCGSVGSKLVMHAARSGQGIAALSDASSLRPHNMARHALTGQHLGKNKAKALAKELSSLGLKPSIFEGDVAVGLRDPKRRADIIPSTAKLVLNATASLAVREALIDTAAPRDRTRHFEAALFAKARIGYLLADGKGHNPNHADLMAELYATLDDKQAAKLLFDPTEGLTQIPIGQGCGSLTMPVDDAQLSMMTGALSAEIGRAIDKPSKDGTISLGVSDEDRPAIRWMQWRVGAFETVPIAGSDGWELRISPRVADRIRGEAKQHPTVETGGIMIGLSSARLKTVTVVDVLDAPPDSERSAHLFMLGVEGLQAEIERRHLESGRTLFDVGTWHSHLADHGPSPTDWKTAADLAAERAPPSVLLITTPKRFHALIVPPKDS